ncbi:MAG: cupin domain-containing protein [Rhodopirellula sp.]|nr:cupin domain-containing protein [Rhodopirellula sp.]
MGIVNNIYESIPGELPNECFTAILATDAFRMERIVSRGHASPEGVWYDQDRNEWVIVLEGAARLRFEGEEDVVELNAGDHLSIPANRRHRVEWTAPDRRTVWLAIHYES